MSNLSFLVEVSKTACFEQIMLPRLEYEKYPISLQSEFEETTILGPLPLMPDIGDGYKSGDPTEEDLLFQSRINTANVRDLRLHAQHGLPQVACAFSQTKSM